MKIQNYSPEITTSPENIKKAVDWLDNPDTRSRVSSNANYYRVPVKGQGEPVYGGICHAGMNGRGRTDCVALWTDAGGRGADGCTDKYLDWLCTESFAAEFILSCRPTGIVVTTDCYAGVLQNIAIMTRHCRELPAVTFNLFDHFLEKGFSGDIAYVFSMNTLRQSNHLSHELAAHVFDYGGGHRAWPLFSIKALNNFLNGDFKIPEDAKPYRDAPSIYGGVTLCGAKNRFSGTEIYKDLTHELFENKDFLADLSAFRKGTLQTEGYKPPNPFVRSPVSSIGRRTFTYQETIDFVIPYMFQKGLLNVNA